MNIFSGRIVAIHGAPRSGTSWLGQLFNSSENVAYRYQPLFSYAFKQRLTSTSTRREIELFFDDLLFTEDDFVLQRGAASLAGYSLEFEKADGQGDEAAARRLKALIRQYEELIEKQRAVERGDELLGIALA